MPLLQHIASMLLLIGLLCPAAQAAGQPDPLGDATARRAAAKWRDVLSSSHEHRPSAESGGRNAAGHRWETQLSVVAKAAAPRVPATRPPHCLISADISSELPALREGILLARSAVEEGAEAILNLAVADELDGRSGQFYNGLRPSKANPQAYDDTARERLRVLSLQLTGLA
jgi:hypothetical protein